MEANELKESILRGTIQVFNKKGLKFTMDDIARELSISKKTIYTVFTDKGALVLQMVDYIFDSMIHQVRIHQIVTAVKPTCLTLEVLIFQIFNYSLID